MYKIYYACRPRYPSIISSSFESNQETPWKSEKVARINYVNEVMSLGCPRNSDPEISAWEGGRGVGNKHIIETSYHNISLLLGTVLPDDIS